MSLLNSPKPSVRETVICGIGSAAHAAQAVRHHRATRLLRPNETTRGAHRATMEPWRAAHGGAQRFIPFAAVVNQLLQAMTLSGDDHVELRSLATDTIGTVAVAIGREAFQVRRRPLHTRAGPRRAVGLTCSRSQARFPCGGGHGTAAVPGTHHQLGSRGPGHNRRGPPPRVHVAALGIPCTLARGTSARCGALLPWKGGPGRGAGAEFGHERRTAALGLWP